MKRTLNQILFFFIAGLFLKPCFVHAQNTEGYHFITSLHERYSTIYDKCYITSSFNTCVNLKIPTSNVDTTFYILKDTIYALHIDSISRFFYPDSLASNCYLTDKNIEFTANYPITITRAYRLEYMDSHILRVLLPEEKEDKEYTVINSRGTGHSDGAYTCITSYDDNNSIYIIPIDSTSASFNNCGYPLDPVNGDTIVLQKGETAFSVGDSKWKPLSSTGTLIKGEKPIAVKTQCLGNSYTNENPCGNGLDNYDYQRMQTFHLKPNNQAGQYFLISPIHPTESNYFTLAAIEANTQVFVNGILAHNLDARQSWDTCFFNPLVVQTSKPVNVAQFVQNVESTVPFQVTHVGLQSADTSEFITKSWFNTPLFSTQDSSFFKLNIFTRTAHTNDFLLNSQPLNGAIWQTFPTDSRFSWCVYRVPVGEYLLENPNGFSAIYYPYTSNKTTGKLGHASAYYLPGLMPSSIAADSLKFYYSTGTSLREVWPTEPIVVCGNGSFTFYPNIAQNTTWLWNFGDGATFTQRVLDERAGSVSHTFSQIGQYWVTVTDSAGCSVGDSILIIIEEEVVADFTSATTSSCSGTMVALQNQSFGATNYFWQWPSGSSTAQNPSFNYTGSDSTITITLIASNQNCADTTTRTISIQPLSFNPKRVPNVFSPNNDGVNDAFCIAEAEAFADCFFLQIFNRWGSEVFHTQNPQNCWQAENTAEGVYFYVLKIGEQQYNGQVTVFK